MPAVRGSNGRFVGQAERIANAFRARVTQAFIAIVVEAQANLVTDTPVDLGWARANWRMGVGSPRSGAVGVAPPRPKKGQPHRAIAFDGDEAGLASVLRWKVGDGKLYLWNNAPYIRPLIKGSSEKAPAGWYQAGINRAITRGKEVFGDAAGSIAPVT